MLEEHIILKSNRTQSTKYFGAHKVMGVRAEAVDNVCAEQFVSDRHKVCINMQEKSN